MTLLEERSPAKHVATDVSLEYTAMDYNQNYYQNIWHRILTHYTPSSQIRDFGDLIRARIVSRLIHRYVLAKGMKSTLSMTDCGCGNWLYLGDIYHVLAAYPEVSVSLQGVDYSEEAMTFGLTKFAANRPNNVHIETHAGELRDILGASEDESVDCLVCLEVLEHVPYDREAIQTFCRVLKPGGTVIISVPSNQPFPLSLNWFEYCFFQKRFTTKDTLVGHLRRYCIEDMIKLQALPMHAVHIEPYGFLFSDYVKKVANWLDKHIPYIGKRTFPLFRQLLFLEHSCWNRIAHKSEGFFIVLQKKETVCL